MTIVLSSFSEHLPSSLKICVIISCHSHPLPMKPTLCTLSIMLANLSHPPDHLFSKSSPIIF
jgi:hypothetical protein